jgi:hypothetical protein
MGLTATSLPYPEPTEQVRNGAADIQALAESLDPRVPYKIKVISGGFTTAAQGGIAFTVPFPNVVAAAAMLVGAGSIGMQRASGAPPGQVWINPFNTTNGQLVTNTFLALDLIVWGY